MRSAESDDYAGVPRLQRHREQSVHDDGGPFDGQELVGHGELAAPVDGQRVQTIMRLLLAAHSQVGAAGGRAEARGEGRVLGHGD